MLVSEKCAAEAACGLLKHMLADGSFYVITAFVGCGVEAEHARLVEDFVQQNYPEVELYLTDGGQDVYPFIFIAE
jgi:dihydroxyacetone kinase-like predicted kinase